MAEMSFMKLLLLPCLFLPLCIAQRYNVNEFKSATWNTNGPRWDVVQSVMNTYTLDVFAIQEAGSITRIQNQLSNPTGYPLPFCYAGFQVNDDLGYKEYIWNSQSGQFYMYYYDNAMLNGGTRQGTTKQNLAFITRERASEVMLVPPEVRHTSVNAAGEQDQSRTFINRPALGIRMGRNSVFFNIHTEPIRTRNEAPALINGIQNYVRDHYYGHTWMVMGDINRTPAELQPQLPPPNPGNFIDIVRSGQPTHNTEELDYSIVGGPLSYRANVVAIWAQLLQLPVANPSDHYPVKFN